jgi:glutaredoxin
MYYVLTRNDCDYCEKAKDLLIENGKAYSQTNILADPLIIKLMIISGLRTVPQIWYYNEYIGGYNEVREHLSSED